MYVYVHLAAKILATTQFFFPADVQLVHVVPSCEQKDIYMIFLFQ
jgi:hypothetical protein